MRLVQTAIPEVVIVEPAVFRDDRGWFSESWIQASFNAAKDRRLEDHDLGNCGLHQAHQ